MASEPIRCACADGIGCASTVRVSGSWLYVVAHSCYHVSVVLSPDTARQLIAQLAPLAAMDGALAEQAVQS